MPKVTQLVDSRVLNENLGFLSTCVILLPLYHVALIHSSVISWFPLWQSEFLKPMIFKPFKKGSSNVLHYMYTGKKQLLCSWAAVGIEELETHHINNHPPPPHLLPQPWAVSKVNPRYPEHQEISLKYHDLCTRKTTLHLSA